MFLVNINRFDTMVKQIIDSLVLVEKPVYQGVVKTAFFMIEIVLSVFSIPLYIINIGKC